MGPAGFGGATGASESKTQGADVEGRPRGQRRPAGRPWANQPQMKNTQHAEAVVSARRRRRAVEAAPKITCEIWIPGAQITRPTGAPRPSLWRGVAWASPGWPGEAALTWGGVGPADVVELYSSRFCACDPRCGPPECPGPAKGPRPGGAPGPLPRPRTLPGPPTWRPSFSPEQPAAEGRGGIRGFATQMNADLSRAV